jgi:hypothetical protein
MARSLRSLGVIFLILLAGAAVAQIPAMQAVDLFVARHHFGFMAAAIVFVALGFGLFFGGLIVMTIHKGRWLSGKELDEYYRGMSQPVLGFRVKFAGGATRFAARDPFTLGDIKEAWRQGGLWRPPTRNRVIRLIGAILTFLGLCLVQFSLAATALKGYAIVLLLAGVVWLVTRWARA